MTRFVVVSFVTGPPIEYGPFRGAVRIDYESDGALRISTRRWGVTWRTYVYHPATDAWTHCQAERARGEAEAARLARIARFESTRRLPPP